jgi:hypothetical protein
MNVSLHRLAKKVSYVMFCITALELSTTGFEQNRYWQWFIEIVSTPEILAWQNL